MKENLVSLTNPHCGRERLQECSNAKIVCEKCSWEPAANDYNYDHLSLNA